MNVRPRLLLTSLTSVKTGMSMKTKPPTYYETLHLNSRATQGEIKSAYFKLSKQYHPDKNNSDEAIDKFRDITEAYEVLGSYESRRKYDRSILTHTPYNVPHAKEKPGPKVQYYQSQAAIFRRDGRTSAPMYDFDAWTKAHYGNVLARTIRDKRETAKLRRERKEDYPSYKGRNDMSYLILAFILMTGMVLLGFEHKDDQYSTFVIDQKNDFDSIDESETK